MKILLTGGGTAGHVMPHLALLDDFRKNYDTIIYIGSKDGIERSLIEKEKDVKYYPITSTKLVRGKVFANLLIPFRLIKATHQAKKIIKAEQPNVIFSKGGYVSLPVVFAAKRYKVPVIAHESDLNMGLANRLSKRYCTIICTTFKQTADGEKKGLYTGSPLRESLKMDKAEAKKNLKIDSSLPVLVITGGSLGSQFLNQKIWSELYSLTKKFYVIHLVGKGNADKRLDNYGNYRQIEFAYNMGEILAAADVVVSRAGSNTIFELATLLKPMLLVPLPKGASRGDQVDNAKYFNREGYANFVTQQQLEDTPILPYIVETYRQRDAYISAMKKAGFEPANKKIMDVILTYTKK